MYVSTEHKAKQLRLAVMLFTVANGRHPDVNTVEWRESKAAWLADAEQVLELLPHLLSVLERERVEFAKHLEQQWKEKRK
jgi:hypothetical protein